MLESQVDSPCSELVHTEDAYGRHRPAQGSRFTAIRRTTDREGGAAPPPGGVGVASAEAHRPRDASFGFCAESARLVSVRKGLISHRRTGANGSEKRQVPEINTSPYQPQNFRNGSPTTWWKDEDPVPCVCLTCQVVL